MGRTTSACFLILGALLLACPPAQAQPACPTEVKVTDVRRVKQGIPVALPRTGAQLDDTIRVTGPNLAQLAACAGAKRLVLFASTRRRPVTTPIPGG